MQWQHQQGQGTYLTPVKVKTFDIRGPAGPAYEKKGSAQIYFAPDVPEVRLLMERVAKAVSCPDASYKRICSSDSITTFSCLFSVQGVASNCTVRPAARC